MENKVRVRFAPSPTGYMHVGNFRTALFGYLFAKKNNGEFILRVEDTDKNRFVDKAIEGIIDILEWAGMQYEEGVFVNPKSQKTNSKQTSNLKIVKSQTYPNLFEVGNFGPYIQSERLDIYKKYAQELVKSGKAYYCFCTPERLEEMRSVQMAQKIAPMYDRTCLKLPPEEVKRKIESGEKYVIRQKIDAEGFTEYDDLIRGKVQIKNELLDDQILLKSDGYPTYNFANVVDDYLMGITHVLRGEEYVSSTPKFIQLYKNFGWEVPMFAHLPLLLNPDKSKLSKRQGDVAVEDYIKKGYLKEAIINFVALLGWNPGEGSTQEIFSLEELTQKFDLSHVHKAGAIFDIKKLDWINGEYIKRLSSNDLYQYAINFLQDKEFYKAWNVERGTWNEKMKEDYVKKVLAIERERLQKLSEIGESNKFFFQDVDCDKELLRWKEMSDDVLRASLTKSKNILENISEENWTRENLEKILMEESRDDPARIAMQSVAGGRGVLLWPLRAALTGEKKSPSPFEVAWVLGKEESLKRVEKALAKI